MAIRGSTSAQGSANPHRAGLWLGIITSTQVGTIMPCKGNKLEREQEP
jgi:hypothetical protein